LEIEYVTRAVVLPLLTPSGYGMVTLTVVLDVSWLRSMAGNVMVVMLLTVWGGPLTITIAGSIEIPVIR
jgi:hypothetical protein